VLVTTAAFCQGSPSLTPADGLDNWSHDFDTSKLPPGTYNIVVETVDQAGNHGTAGPINIYVDPAAALPHVSIINPTNLLRVGGNLMVVGTCVAESGVSRVEVRIDDGEYQPSQGGEFWSLEIPTRDIPEGRRTLEVRGIDGNGVAGKSVKVAFDLDRTAPAAAVSSPAPGTLVAGKVRISGTVTSANGVSSLAASTDDAKTFSKVDVAHGKTPSSATFSFDLDTTRFPDGPRIIWLRSADGVGVSGITAFLVFVANSKPAIEARVLFGGTTVHGRFSVAGAVRSPIGIVKLGYELNGEKPVDLPLTPGDPYFAQELDAREIKGDKAAIVVVAQDRAGNVARYPVSAKIDHAADVPVLKVIAPAPLARVGSGDFVWGSITADEGGAGIRVTVDGGKPTELPASDVFSFPLPPGLASGKHLLSIQPRDGHGTWGNPVNLAVTVDAGPTTVKFVRVAADRGSSGAASAAAYVPGVRFRVTDGMWLEGSLAAPNPTARVVYSIAGGAEHRLELTGGASFRIPLDRSLPYGFVPIEVRGQNAFGQDFVGRALLYSVDLSADREDTGFRFDDPRIGDDHRVALRADDPLLGAFYGEEIDSLRLDPPSGLAKVSFDGRTVRVEMTGDGATDPERIVVRTKRGHEVSSDAFVLASDSGGAGAAGPSLSSVSWVQGKTTVPWVPGMPVTLGSGSQLTGTVRFTGKTVTVEYRVNDGPLQKASLGKQSGTEAPFVCNLPSVPSYGRFVAEVTARDAAGLQTKRRYDFHDVLPALKGAAAADTAAAIRFFDTRIADISGGSLVTLGPQESLAGTWNGRPLKTVTLVPATPLAEASFDGEQVTLTARQGGAAKSPGFRIHAETVDGDVAEWGPFGIVTRSAAPALTLQTPEDNQWVRMSVHVAGSVEAPDGLQSLEVSVNGAEFAPLPSGKQAVSSGAQPAPSAGNNPGARASPFDTEIPLDQVADGAVRIDLRARDAAGGEAAATRFFNKSTTLPVVTQVYPADEEIFGPTTVVGTAAAAGHVASVQFLPSAKEAPEDVSGNPAFSHRLDMARLPNPLPEGGGFVVVDRAGNQTLFAPKLNVNKERGKPVVRIQTPGDQEILTSDFSVSGTAFDYAGVAKVLYRIDASEWKSIELKDAGFSVPVTLDSTTDNEHLFEAYAQNIFGIDGEVASRTFRVSKEEPRALMTAPDIARAVRGVIEISGTASDANGIDSVSLSFDNGATYMKATGSESWRYTLDTTILSDGLHAITIRPVDKYGVTGFSASLITVDNTPPGVQLALPRDGEVDYGAVQLSGRTWDNGKLAGVRAEVIPIGKDKPPALTVDLGGTEVVRSTIDVSSLTPGPYTLRVVGRDDAGNEAFVSRDIVVTAVRPPDTVDLFSPVSGEKLSGRLRVLGRAVIAGGASAVTIFADGTEIGAANVDTQGNFAYDVPSDQLEDGTHVLSARGTGAAGTAVESRPASVTWTREGPWLAIDSPVFGKFLFPRPWLSGKAGWASQAPDPKDAKAFDAWKKLQDRRKVRRIDVSLDNGRTFRGANGSDSWRFRLETQDYPEGEVFLLVRASFTDDSSAVARTRFYLDKVAPEVHIVAPAENVRVGSRVHVAGTAADEESRLASVGVALRKGDKRGYELPAFIQGLYLDGHFFGATTWEAGLGLSFFGDNVKLQAMYGQAPAADADGNPQRFFGNVFSAKLIANVLYLPFSVLLGPDWDSFSCSIGLGTEFSFFDMNGTSQGKGLSAVIAQLEIPKYTLRSAPFLKKYSLYLEEQAWFIPSDVPDASTILLSTTVGVRLGIF
jgi:hypothetical protein